MKKSFISYLALSIFIVSLGFITGCSKPLTPEEEAKEVIRAYMEKLYRVEDFTEYKDRNIEMDKVMEIDNKLKPYMTENGYNEHWGNRDLIMLLWAARNRQANVSLENLELQLGDQKEDDIWFRYTANIKLTYMDKAEENFEIMGQIQTVKEEDVWKINIDRPSNYPLQSLHDYITKDLHEVINTSHDGIYSELKSYVNAMFFAVSNTTDEKLNLRFPNSKTFNLVLYKDGTEVWQYGDEVSSFDQKSFVRVLDKGESIVFCVDYPFKIDSGEYEYKFNINTEEMKGLPPLEGKLVIKK